MEFDYDQYKNDELKRGGFNPDILSDDQKDLILQPTEAPENYMCDGEITPHQAFKTWCKRLRASGLNEAQFAKAINLHFK